MAKPLLAHLVRAVGRTASRADREGRQGRTPGFTPGAVRRLRPRRASCSTSWSPLMTDGRFGRNRFSRPAACCQTPAHVLRHGRLHLHRIPVLVDRHDDLPRMKMQHRPALARRRAVDGVAEDRPAFAGRVNPELMSAACERFSASHARGRFAPDRHRGRARASGSGRAGPPRRASSTSPGIASRRPSGLSIRPSSPSGPPSTTAQ